MAQAHYLQDNNGEKFYPYAHADATYDKNGNTVGDRLDDIEESIPNSASDIGAISTALKGSNNGVAELDANGKVPSSQLPSYVDDVIEGYYNNTNDRFYSDSAFNTLITPESGKSWVDISTNKSYRWTGSVYTRVDEGVQLGETSSTAYRGDRGKIAYDHSQSTHARTDATNVSGSTTNGNIKINNIETNVYTHPGSGTNPHGTTASDVGLNNVDNTSDANKPISNAVQTALNTIIEEYSTGGHAQTLGHYENNRLENTSDVDGFRSDYMMFANCADNASPIGDDGLILWIPYDANYGQQFYLNDTGTQIYHRYYTNGNWSSWKRIYDDDYHPSADYATTAGSATDSTKLPLAGGTMTGDILTNQTIRPTTSGSGYLGNSSYYFGYGYITNLTTNGTIRPHTNGGAYLGDAGCYFNFGYITNLVTNGMIRPSSNDSSNIGTPNYKFGIGYINTLNSTTVNSTTVAASSNMTVNNNNVWHAGNLNFSLSGTTLTITTS